MERLLSVRDDVLRAVSPLEPEEVALHDASGRVLAEDALAHAASPPFACAAMDGYAVRAADASEGARLTVVDTVFAGDAAARSVGRGEAARIFTGGRLPAGADAVVMQEVVTVEGDRARIGRPVGAGENVRQAGEDLALGAVALRAGTRLGARQVALLVSVGAVRVAVRRRPRVVVISTGEEIVGGSVPDSNGPAVAGVLRAAGAQVATRAVGDGLEAIAGALTQALADADAVVTVGGVSVGERDHVAAAVTRAGGETRVHGVPMKPGKPFLFALAEGKPILGLPGSPSACLVALEVFARPAILRLSGAARVERRAIRVALAAPAAGRPGRARLLWAVLEPGGRARPLGRDSAQVRGPALADALLLVPEAAGELPAGAEVQAWLLDDDA